MKLWHLSILVLLSGCETVVKEPTPPPMPEIIVETQEQKNSVEVKISFTRVRTSDGWPHLYLETLKDIEAYEEQVKFLLARLEEAKKKKLETTNEIRLQMEAEDPSLKRPEPQAEMDSLPLSGRKM